MKILWKAIVFLLYPIFTLQSSSPSSLSYTAAVAEYAPVYSSTDENTAANINTENYITFIKKAFEYSVDILVFPESSLSLSSSNNLTVRRSEAAAYIPDPKDKIVPCNHQDYYPNSIRKISCAARKYNMYIAINHREKYDCSGDSCPEDGLLIYNTNVVFNRKGEVIARYRKYNLFAELDTNRTLEPILSTFETDFGVTFGQIICFDIMFKAPTLSLVRDLGIKDIIFSNHWYSEMPYLYAVQVQAGWAFANDVNLLASGHNNPRTASGGSGIYVGRKGYVRAILENKSSNILVVSEIPKVIDGKRFLNINQKNSQVYSFSKSEVSTTKTDTCTKYHHIFDNLEPYTTELLDFNMDSYDKILCNRNLCCDFKIRFHFNASPSKDDINYYRYRTAIFNGTRTFSGYATGGVTVCGVIPCINDKLNSCGKLFETDLPVEAATTFESINISMKDIYSKNNINMPITFTKSMVPLNATDFSYETININNATTYNLFLKKSRNDLLTFSVYGRNFDLDSLAVTADN